MNIGGSLVGNARFVDLMCDCLARNACFGELDA